MRAMTTCSPSSSRTRDFCAQRSWSSRFCRGTSTLAKRPWTRSRLPCPCKRTCKCSISADARRLASAASWRRYRALGCVSSCCICAWTSRGARGARAARHSPTCDYRYA
ncbi:hypothetical protein AMAG_20131 [Allomyces macrogynus ATCC 38327]|uniref:Uncharacterized protein n=1 Tax=Allomyces macrogynus (strain ATCC 38327) TaxID=578462 RepID=A0A0L0T574_ALLM3|nr:hypothetical protein AMAG_20131 [Allomyces macrogynus ATCC 38327]|eukprot:KNE69887.1 hypothetical protein AMAG_20131 [Allomyces macrogynus ATCC 38327]